MKNIKIILLFLFLSSCDYGIVEKEKLYEAAEAAYFEGQKDALNGEIKIKKNQDSCWIWTKSPWESGRRPIYDPSYTCE